VAQSLSILSLLFRLGVGHHGYPQWFEQQGHHLLYRSLDIYRLDHDSIFPCCVVSLFDDSWSEKMATACCRWIKALQTNVSRRTIWSVVLRFSRNRHWTGVRSLCFYKYQTRRSLIICSTILHIQLISAMGW